MKLYSNVITEDDVREAFASARKNHGADIWIDTDYGPGLRSFKPRGPCKNGVQFYAESFHGNRATGHRAIGSYPMDSVSRAASWSDYGTVIALLYLKDPTAKIGWYESREDFLSKVRQAYKSYRKRESISFTEILGR